MARSIYRKGAPCKSAPPMHAGSRRVDSPTPPVGSGRQIVRAVALVGLLMAWNGVSSLISERYHVGRFSLTSPAGLAFTLLDLFVYLGLIISIGCVRLGKTSLHDLGWRASSLPRMVAFGLVQTALLVGLVFAAYWGLAGLRGVRGLANAIASMPVSERVFYVVAGAKVAFVEETLFRGDLLGKLSLRTSIVAGVALSSILFALYHRTLAPVPLGMKFVLGTIFAVFTIRTRSLIPSAIAHWLLWIIVGNN
jgi:membrane protease YdiL (CAAX protease family)